MTRAFVAVRPPAGVLDAVADVSAGLELAHARRTTRDQWHVTLQFLGNHADVDAVASALAGLDVTAGNARLGGVGAFPNARRASVVWIGLAHGAEFFESLARSIGARLAPIGYEPEARPFHAHLTIARCKTPGDVRAAIAGSVNAVGEPWRVDEVLLFESRLEQSGARYEARARFPLG